MSIINIKTLCDSYSQANHRERLVGLFRDFDRVLVTSSFGTTSVMLLHLVHQIKPDHPVYFIDTGYHFQETHDFIERLKRQWNLNVVYVGPKRDEQTWTRKQRLWEKDQDMCCGINKVNPLTRLKRSHDVWVSGMLGGTTELREELPIFVEDGDIIRCYPFIDRTEAEAAIYKRIHKLPSHPLEALGYGSIGCSHCTQRGEGRSGRWADSTKTECGLHWN